MKDKISQYLNGLNWSYEFNSEQNSFYWGIHSQQAKYYCFILFNEESFSCFSIFPQAFAPHLLNEVLNLLFYINLKLNLGTFIIDQAQDKILFKTIYRKTANVENFDTIIKENVLFFDRSIPYLNDFLLGKTDLKQTLKKWDELS